MNQNEGPQRDEDVREGRRGITGPRFRVLPFYRQIRGIPVWWFAGRSPSTNIAFWVKRHVAQGFGAPN